MGNQLCPADKKEILSNFQELEKGDRSVSLLVANYLARNKAQEESSLSNDMDGKSEVNFIPRLKFKPEAILEALEN